MEDLAKLKYLFLEKKSHPDKAKFSKKQLKILNELLREDVFEDKFVNHILQQIKSLESHEEFNISADDYKKLLKQKQAVIHFKVLFEKEISEIRKLLESLRRDIGSPNEELILHELETVFSQVDVSKKAVENYFNDIKHLKYDKRFMAFDEVISKIIKNTLFLIHTQGLNNIPKNGPCIFAPRHYNAMMDPIILKSIIPRKLFFLTSVETFVFLPFYRKIAFDTLLYKLGCQPIKRDDSKFAPRLDKAVPKEWVDAFPSSNGKSLYNALIQLKYGESLVIFPEAEAKRAPTYARPNDEEFLEPQEGFLMLAYLAKRKFGINVPIIPVGFHYHSFKEKVVEVRFGQPIILPDSIQSLSKKELSHWFSIYKHKIFEIIIQLSAKRFGDDEIKPLEFE